MVIVVTFRQFVGNKAKVESPNGCFKKTKYAKLSEKEHFLLSDMHTCAYQGVKNVRFSEKLACIFFLETPVLRSPFCLLTDKFLFFTGTKN